MIRLASLICVLCLASVAFGQKQLSPLQAPQPTQAPLRLEQPTKDVQQPLRLSQVEVPTVQVAPQVAFRTALVPTTTFQTQLQPVTTLQPVSVPVTTLQPVSVPVSASDPLLLAGRHRGGCFFHRRATSVSVQKTIVRGG